MFFSVTSCLIYRLGRLLFGIGLLLVGVGNGFAQQLPTYQVVFDDFKYAPAVYQGALSSRDTTGGNNLFGTNRWTGQKDRFYRGRAWYYFNWSSRCTLDPNAQVQVTNAYYGSVKLEAFPGFRRSYNCGASVPPQIELGATRRTGTWAVRMRLADLEQIKHFTQAFWLISPYRATYKRENKTYKEWSEFNYEWQNWFNSRKWRKSLARGEAREPKRRTYMSNGVRMYEQDSDDVTADPARGGVPLRGVVGDDSFKEDLRCYVRKKTFSRQEKDPSRCMALFTEDLTGKDDQWVELMIQYDGQELRFTAAARTSGVGYMMMKRTLSIGRRSLPLKTVLDQHTASAKVQLENYRSTEIDWFYYAPRTDIAYWDVIHDVGYFRTNKLPRVNVKAEPLQAPSAEPWQVRLEPPVEGASVNEWVALPTQREHNRYHLQWSFRHKKEGSSGWSPWSDYLDGGFSYQPPVESGDVELRVRVDDRSQKDRPEWANACQRFSFSTGDTAACTKQTGRQ